MIPKCVCPSFQDRNIPPWFADSSRQVFRHLAEGSFKTFKNVLNEETFLMTEMLLEDEDLFAFVNSCKKHN